jgi:acyl dehydratase
MKNGAHIPALRRAIETGMVLPPLKKGRITHGHIMRWCAAQQNWDKVHFNQDYVRRKARLPDVFVNGAIKQQFVSQFLTEAFEAKGWIWRIDHRFHGIDFAGDVFELEGKVAGVGPVGSYLGVDVEVGILNRTQRRQTTTCAATVLFDQAGGPVLDVVGADLPDARRVPTATLPATTRVPDSMAKAIGTTLDRIDSFIPTDLGRLRLFAEAIMDVRPIHWDPAVGARSPYGRVVAPPLYPMHGLEVPPGTRQLSQDPDALGREGVTDVGRPDGARFGIDSAGVMNGGNQVEVHSLLQVGEKIRAESVVAGAAFHDEVPGGGPGLSLDTVNRYWESSGRPLLTERQTMLYRLPG